MAVQDLAVYVHWPWCKAKCPYCDFNSHAGSPREDDYVGALLNEFSHFKRTWGHDGRQYHLKSLFFGGGTPSLMRAQSIRRLVEGVRALGDSSSDLEVTVECNPTSFATDAAARRFFEDLQAAGVNRISIGIQGLNEEWLRFLGREHSVADALATLEAAQSVFANVNADVIYGLPAQDLAEWRDFLGFLAGRGLAHISAYQLTIEPNTRFYKDVKDKRWTPVDSDVEADFFEATRAVLSQNGYQDYETSNFCKPDMECRHNLHVWRYGAYAGFGAGAHGRLHDAEGCVYATRVLRQPEAYLKAAQADIGSVSQVTKLSPAETLQEAIFAGLRLTEGVDMERLLKRLPEGAYQEAVDDAERAFLEAQGLISCTPERWRLTPAGWPLLNGILQRLLRPLSV